jgi:hypothetical protein
MFEIDVRLFEFPVRHTIVNMRVTSVSGLAPPIDLKLEALLPAASAKDTARTYFCRVHTWYYL